jgi:AraC-like DNA-binding protein
MPPGGDTMIQSWEPSMTMQLCHRPHPARSTGRQTLVANNVRHDQPRGHFVPAGVIRLGAAREIVSVLRDLDASPDRIIAEAGLDARLFDDGNNTVPFAALGRLLSLCVARTSCPVFGLLVGQKASISALGLLGGLMQHSPTVGDALHSFVRHLHLQDRGAAPLLSVAGDVAVLSYAIYEPRVESADQISDAAIATILNLMRALCGPEWTPTEVLLPRRSPTDPTPYRRLFGASVRFDEETAALVFPARWLDHRIAGADAVFHGLFAERIAELESLPEVDFRDDLRRILRSRLLSRNCSAGTIADLFSMHRRTLNRRLSAEGTGFRTIVEEMRFEIACQMLAGTMMPFIQIAAALSFSEASAFSRAFRRWSGQTPTAWRASHAAPDGGPRLVGRAKRGGRRLPYRGGLDNRRPFSTKVERIHEVSLNVAGRP